MCEAESLGLGDDDRKRLMTTGTDHIPISCDVQKIGFGSSDLWRRTTVDVQLCDRNNAKYVLAGYQYNVSL